MPNLQQIIENSYNGCGFDAAAVVPFAPLDDQKPLLGQWLDAGYAGELGYMERSRDYRHDLRRVMPGVRSVVVTLTGYKRPDALRAAQQGLPRIAQYAWGDDYHTVTKHRLYQLLDTVRRNGHPSVRGRAVVDSAPTLDRAWAIRAGLGWKGRNAMLIHPELGPAVTIGLLLLDIGIEEAHHDRSGVPETWAKSATSEKAKDSATKKTGEIPPPETYLPPVPVPDGCGNCRRCIDACPRGAIADSAAIPSALRVIDARRCISYYTIANGSMPVDADRTWIFGCDLCLETCPHYTKAPTGTHISVRPELLGITREAWFAITPQQFAERMKGTPLQDTSLEKIRKILER